MNDAIIVSDLHLGSDLCQDRKFIVFLEKLPQTARLVLNGDVLENTDIRLKKKHWKVLSEIRKKSNQTEVVWIAGNHDEEADSIAHLIGANFVPSYQFTSGGKRVLCTHGDLFDDWYKRYPVLTYVADVTYGWLQKLDGFHALARKAKHSSKKFVRCVENVEKGGIELAREQHCEIVLCGHTHHAYLRPGVITYANSGCWTEKPCSYLTVKDGKVNLEWIW